MAESMVHRVANEMMKADWRGERETPPDAKIANYYAMARAAIEAMREPTMDMCRAYGPDFLDNGAVWQAMIDAALATSATDTASAVEP